MTKLRAAITGVHGYVPEYVLTNQELETMVDTNDEWITTRTGIKERRILKGEGLASSDLGVGAIEGLLLKRGVAAEEIDCIICATATPDMIFPSTACIIADKIGAKNAFAYDLMAACSGFLFSLATASKYIETGAYKKIIVVGADKMSSIVDYTDRQTCIIFGDGAGGVILEASKSNTGILGSVLKTDGSGADSLNVLAGGSKYPASPTTIKNRQHYIKQDGKKVFKFAIKRMSDVSTKLLEDNGLAGKDIKLFIPHQANKRIIEATGERCNIPLDRVMINIDKYGNTTAGTIPIALNEAVESNLISNGDYILLAAFGSGFTWGSILIKWDTMV